MKDREMAQKIIDLSGGKENFVTVVNCMTRVRVTFANEDLVQMEELKKLDFVQGVVVKDTVQIIVGPGRSTKIRVAIEELLGKSSNDSDESNKKNGKKTSNILKIFSSIFVPIIPAIIASGIVQGLNNILTNNAAIKAAELGIKATETLTATQVMLQSWNMLQVSTILGIIGSATFSFLAIYVGITSAKVFGTDTIIGGLVGAMTISSSLGVIGLKSGQGGLMGVILAVYILSKVEKLLRKVIPDIVAVVVIPVLSAAIVAILLFFAVMPITGVLTTWITNGLMAILNFSGVLGGFILAAGAPSLIATGLHQGLLPINLELINATGSTALNSIQIMSNAGMVGAAIAVFLLTKDPKMKNVAKAAIPTSFLAVGEPCIYGVNIPAGFAFITGSIGAGFGGAMIRLLDVQTSALGAAGMSAIPLIAHGKYLQYLICYFVGAIAAFIITYVVGKARKYE
jgi:PTS system sucrose-specific IIC component